MKLLVLEVWDVTVERVGGDTPRWIVRASGHASTPGWHDAELVARVGGEHDGLIHLDFVAVPPDTPTIQVIMPIAAATNLPVREGVSGVVVHARLNEQTGPVSSGTGVRAMGGGGDMPTPFRVIVQSGGGDSPTPFRLIVQGNGGDAPTPFFSIALDATGRPALSGGAGSSCLVGMKLRVVRPGDVITQEVDFERVNLYVDNDERITQVTVG